MRTKIDRLEQALAGLPSGMFDDHHRLVLAQILARVDAVVDITATGHENRYLTRVLGEAAVGAGRTDTVLGAHYRRLARRRGANCPAER